MTGVGDRGKEGQKTALSCRVLSAWEGLESTGWTTAGSQTAVASCLHCSEGSAFLTWSSLSSPSVRPWDRGNFRPLKSKRPPPRGLQRGRCGLGCGGSRGRGGEIVEAGAGGAGRRREG